MMRASKPTRCGGWVRATRYGFFFGPVFDSPFFFAWATAVMEVIGYRISV
jgi:hypothetical protein